MTVYRAAGWLACSLLALAAAPSCGWSGDWPQVLGPQRNGVAAADEKLASIWPASGPAVLWQRPVGSGYAGIAISGDRAILFHRRQNHETVEALDVATGRTVWQDGYPTTFRPQVGEGDGPLCTPTVSGDRVITFGAQGVLSCYELSSGRMLWRRKTHDDFDAREGYFGAGSSPLVDGDRVIVNVGGFQTQSSVVAFNLQTGETLWHAVDDHASYSSPIAATLGGQRLVLVVTRLNCVALDPATGEVRFQFPFGSRGPTVNGASPVLIGDRLFLTASYGVGARYCQLTATAAEDLWRSDEVYSSQYCTPVAEGEVLYGVDGRQDVPPAELKCFDPLTRRVFWTAPQFGYGTLILADDKLLILKSDGTLVLASANRERYDPLATSRVLNGTARALPALANGRLYVRDESTLKCLSVGAAAQAP